MTEAQKRDKRDLERLRDSGALTDREAEFFVELLVALQIQITLRSGRGLTPKQRQPVIDKLRELGLTDQRTAAEIPQGKPVDHLAGIPSSHRKPLRPPGRRS